MDGAMTQFLPQPAFSRCVLTADSANTARIGRRKKQGGDTRSVGWGRESGGNTRKKSEQAVTNTTAAGLPGGSAGIETDGLAPAPVSPGHFNSTTED